MPADFEEKREEYYKALDLPLDAERFIGQLQDEMREALHTLDAGLPKILTCALVRSVAAGSR